MQKEVLFNELPAKSGFFGEIILNRPQAYNALTLNMCTLMYKQLAIWKEKAEIIAVLIKSNAERAFCAGGDVRYFYDNRHLPSEQLLEFFKREYALDAAIYHFPKPYISFLNGITMGGGAGISIHGSHRVATEKLIFAMPETAIGFFPDVGAAHFLTRCPGKIGWYLGLTGNKMDAPTTYALGLANHIINSQDLIALEKKLLSTDLTEQAFNKVSEIIKNFENKSLSSEFMQHQTIIDQCFAAKNMPAILQNLKNINSDFANKTLEILRTRSPTSLQITLEHLNRLDHKSFDEVIMADLELVKLFLRGPDFFEGIRAVLVDKDNAPKWSKAH